jgi:hypothetical protein
MYIYLYIYIYICIYVYIYTYIYIYIPVAPLKSLSADCAQAPLNKSLALASGGTDMP